MQTNATNELLAMGVFRNRSALRARVEAFCAAAAISHRKCRLRGQA